MEPTEEKVRAVRETEPPAYQFQLNWFLPNFATTAEPLRKLTRQDTKWQQGREENEAFEALKNQLTEASMMAHYDKNAPTEIVTDSTKSDLQYQPVQEQRGEKRAIA